MTTKICSTLAALGLLACVTSAEAQTVSMLTPLSTFGFNTDGSIRPGDQPWVDIGNNQRGMAYDKTTGNLVFVDTHSGANGSSAVQGKIYVLDGATGAEVSNLDTNGIIGGNYADAGALVADDGVVYVCNQVTASGSNPFIIYRWDSTTSSNNAPTVAFSGTITPSQRYGQSMDIRGAGTNTQIIIGSMQNSSSGTNVVIFTTADGTNFVPHVLATDVTSASFTDGIAFGEGDTFWAKQRFSPSSPLLLMSFDLATSTAVTLRSYSSSALVASENLGPIAVDVTNKLLAAIEVIQNNAGAEKVRLYDISNTNAAPVLLDIKEYVPNNANATAPPGYLDFGNGKLYSYVVNNGLNGYSVDQVAPVSPVVVSQPAATNRMTVGRTLTMQVLAYPAVSYQWKSNGVSIAGATNASLTLSNLQTSYGAYYTCVLSNGGGTETIASQLNVVNPTDLYHLNLLWSTVAGAQPYINNSGTAGVPNQRTMAYNALSNHLYVVSRSSPTTSNYVVYVVNATNGAVLHTLNTNGVSNYVAPQGGSSGLGLDAIGVADDGAIYASNETPNAGGIPGADPAKVFRLYRWANEDSNTVPVQIFQGDPANQSSSFRWGDNMHVRGSGTNTQILLDNNDNAQRFVAILTPVDDTMTNWTTTYLLQSPPVGTTIGRSLEFGPGDTFFQKRRGAALVQSSFDLSQGSPGVVATLNTYTNFTNTLCGVGLDLNRKLLAGVNIPAASTNDSLDLYEISDLSSPLFLASYIFPKAPHNGNNNFISQTFFVGDMVFSLDAQNGIMAFKVALGPPTPPNFFAQPQNLRLIQGGSGSLSVALDQVANVQWQKNGTNISGATNLSFTISNAQLGDGGLYRLIATNPYGSSTSSVAMVTISATADNYSLTEIWNLPPTSRPYLPADGSTPGQTPLYRNLAYNSLSNQVYVVSRTGASAGLGVHVLDATTGADLYDLTTTGISGGNIILLAIAVGADGSIYAGNMDTTSTNAAVYKLYRWADSGSSTVPALVYSGEPANVGYGVRWGDTLAVRGTGTNTEVVIDSSQGSFVAVLTPTDETLTTFANSLFSESVPNAPIGRSLQFGTGNTIWQKRSGGNLQLIGYDLIAQLGNVVSNFNRFPSTLGPVAMDFSRKLLAGVEFSGNTSAPDKVALYEISDINTPMLIASYNFPENAKPNGNSIAQAIFAGNRVYAVSGNNGIVAYNIVSPAQAELSVELSGSDVIISWPANFSGYTLESTISLTNPSSWSTVGVGAVADGQYRVTNSAAGPAKFYRLRQ